MHLHTLCFKTDTEFVVVIKKQTTFILDLICDLLLCGFYMLIMLCLSFLSCCLTSSKQAGGGLKHNHSKIKTRCVGVQKSPQSTLNFYFSVWFVILLCGMWTIYMVSLLVSCFTACWDRSYLCLIMLLPMLGDLDWLTPVDNQMPLSL